MKIFAMLVAALLMGVPGANAQPVVTAASVNQDRNYQLLREDEDWSFLRDPSLRKDFWDPMEFRTTMGREMVEKSPAWDPDSPVSREYELHLHQHYGYAPYWTVDNTASGAGPPPACFT